MTEQTDIGIFRKFSSKISFRADYKNDIRDKSILINKLSKTPYISAAILLVIVTGAIFPALFTSADPSYMNLDFVNQAPGTRFYFGSDSLGRDIFAMIWHGARVSLLIGITAAFISAFIAVVYGSISGLSNEMIDDAMMRFTEILLSIPSVLVIIFIQAITGRNDPLSIAVVIGITSWMSIAKIVRTEVRQIRGSEYIISARLAGGSFFYILFQHLIPGFIGAVMFMIVTSVGTAIGTEATLSFLGIGLPIEIISWGSMLSLAQDALLSNYWWIIIIPGFFLSVTLVCITNIANYIRKRSDREYSNL